MTFDWGFGAPFSIGWWWVDGDNRVYRFAEWYGWDGKNPNVGLRLTDEQIAVGILEREKALGIDERKIDRIAGPDCFRRKPNYMGGGQGPSTADVFKDVAGALRDVFGSHVTLNLRPGDADREKKQRQFRNRLKVPSSPTELPMLVVYDTCTEFIRTIPSIALDEDNIEVIEDGQEDHGYDEACHICMTLPVSSDVDSFVHAARVAKIAEHVGKLDSASMAAAREMLMLKKQILQQSGLDEELFTKDPSMDPTAFGLSEDFFDQENMTTENVLRQVLPDLASLFK
jgi:hypothetical protein